MQTYETIRTQNSSNQSQIDQYPWQKQHTKPNRIEPINPNIYDSRRERETSRLSNISKPDSIPYDEKQSKQKIIEKKSTKHFQRYSPTSWSAISEHKNDQQQKEIDEKTNSPLSDLSRSSSSHEDLKREKSSASSRTYRLVTDEQQQQPVDGRYVLPSNKYLLILSLN